MKNSEIPLETVNSVLRNVYDVHSPGRHTLNSEAEQ